MWVAPWSRRGGLVVPFVGYVDWGEAGVPMAHLRYLVLGEAQCTPLLSYLFYIVYITLLYIQLFYATAVGYARDANTWLR